MRVAKAIKSGQVFINNYGAGGGVELPFGGQVILAMVEKKDLRLYMDFQL